MKKVLYSLLFLAFVAVSCEKYEPGGTATQSISGDWWVKVEYYDAASNTWEVAIPYGVVIHTYNTAANVPTEIFIDDFYGGEPTEPTFWDIKGKVRANAENATFGSTDTIANLAYDSQFIIVDGQVLKGVGHSKTGITTDSIVFFIKFSDDQIALDEYGWGENYKVSGHRRTGFTEDEY